MFANIFFFFIDTATPAIYTLSLHTALPISAAEEARVVQEAAILRLLVHDDVVLTKPPRQLRRSEEHTSELQSHVNLVCPLLLEQKNRMPNRDLLTLVVLTQIFSRTLRSTNP